MDIRWRKRCYSGISGGRSSGDANYSTFAENEYTPGFYELLYSSRDYTEFTNNLSEHYSDAQVEEQIELVRQLGGRLGQLYDQDLLESGERTEISAEEMFQNLKAGEAAGICGPIHNFTRKVFEEMGIESWNHSGVIGNTDRPGGPEGHIITGAVVTINGQEEILWQNYGQIIMTETDRYKESLGVYEYHQSAAVLPGTIVGSAESLIRSHTQETINELLGQDSATPGFEFVPEESGIEYTITPEQTQVTLKAGMMYVRFGEFNNHNADIYRPLEEAQYIGVGARGAIGDEESSYLRAQAEIGKLNITTKNANIDENSAEFLVAQLAFEGALTGRTNHEWGELTHRVRAFSNLQFSADMESVSNLPESDNLRAVNENQLGYTVFFDPNSSDTNFFISADVDFSVGINDVENQDPSLYVTGKTLSAGMSVRGYTGSFSVTDGELADSLSLEGAYMEGNQLHSLSIGRTLENPDIPGYNARKTELEYSFQQNNVGFSVGVIKEDGESTDVEASVSFRF